MRKRKRRRRYVSKVVKQPHLIRPNIYALMDYYSSLYVQDYSQQKDLFPLPVNITATNALSSSDSTFPSIILCNLSTASAN